MSLISTLTRHGKHRADSPEVANLRDENRRLLTQVVGAGDHIALIERQLADTQARQAEAEMAVVALDADVYDLTAERDQLLNTVTALRRRFAAELAADANANAITVPNAIRDTSNPADQATAPHDVRPLWAALDPAHIPPAA